MQVLKGVPSSKGSKKLSKAEKKKALAESTSAGSSAGTAELEKKVKELQGELEKAKSSVDNDGRVHTDLAQARQQFKEYVSKNAAQPQDYPKVMRQFFGKA